MYWCWWWDKDDVVIDVDVVADVDDVDEIFDVVDDAKEDSWQKKGELAEPVQTFLLFEKQGWGRYWSGEVCQVQKCANIAEVCKKGAGVCYPQA